MTTDNCEVANLANIAWSPDDFFTFPANFNNILNCARDGYRPDITLKDRGYSE